MKKRLLIMMSCFAVFISFTACGKSEEEKEMDAVTSELSDLFEDEETYEAERQEKLAEEQKEEDILASYEKYDAVAGWADVEVYDKAVQIDDTLYIPGCTVRDIMKQIDESAVDYTYDINLDKLIQSRDWETFTIMRDGFEWFTVRSINYKEETVSLGDNVVVGFEISQDAYNFTRFLDGRSIEDFCELSYTDVIAMKGALFSEDLWDFQEVSAKRSSDGENYDVFEISFPVKWDFVDHNLTWTGYELNTGGLYMFVVNSESGKVEDFRATIGCYTLNFKEISTD